MKKLIAVAIFLPVVLVFIQSIHAQSKQTDAAGFRGQSMNGSTGLFSIPSGRLGWEKPNKVGLDFGYRAIINNDHGIAHIPAINVSLFGLLEISTAFDIQPGIKYWRTTEKNDDLLFGLKIKLPINGNSALALGTNFHLLNVDNDRDLDYNTIQPYIAVTFPGNFFKVPAETTVAIGKTFYSGDRPYVNNSNIDFGMGFDVILFPSSLNNLIHWILDFSNFNYSDNAWPNTGLFQTSSVWRGILNTGFRFDLSTIPELRKFKFIIDVIFNDLFDEGSRSFTTGVVFGFGAK